jgi:meiotically up-regulated gene 157 (Mug157) protein
MSEMGHRSCPNILSLLALFTFTRSALAQSTQPASGRPPPEKRKFTSPAVEREIARVAAQIADPELVRLFTDCYPNTLDTTVDFETKEGKPDTFIITGDIHAMWLRDSSCQVQGYLSLCKEDPHLAAMIAGLIHRQASYILLDPYANAFQQDTSKSSPHKKDDTDMKAGVFERKWELDSLLYCIRLGYQYWKVTGDKEAFDSQWQNAMHLAVKTMREQQREKDRGPYHFFRGNAHAGQPGADGYGTPIKYTGMICTMFRDSDDNTKYLFQLPDWRRWPTP